MPLTMALNNQGNGKYKALFVDHSERREEDLQESLLNNIYLAKVESIDADAEFAVVALTDQLKGNLPLKHINSCYSRLHSPPRQKSYSRRDISSILWLEQELLVQVVSVDPLVLSTDLTIPGHFLVLTPHNPRLHLSKKIAQEEERERLMELLKLLDIPEGFGFIIRTDSQGASFEDLQKDYLFLEKEWIDLVHKLYSLKKPSLLKETHALESVVIENFNQNCTAIWLDTPEDYQCVLACMKRYRPEYTGVVQLHKDAKPLLQKF